MLRLVLFLFCIFIVCGSPGGCQGTPCRIRSRSCLALSLEEAFVVSTFVSTLLLRGAKLLRLCDFLVDGFRACRTYHRKDSPSLPIVQLFLNENFRRMTNPRNSRPARPEKAVIRTKIPTLWSQRARSVLLYGLRIKSSLYLRWGPTTHSNLEHTAKDRSRLG